MKRVKSDIKWEGYGKEGEEALCIGTSTLKAFRNLSQISTYAYESYTGKKTLKNRLIIFLCTYLHMEHNGQICKTL